MNIKKELKNTARNSIILTVGGKPGEGFGASKIGGKPDVPEDFIWECYKESADNKTLPLSFLAQFDLEELSKFDTENLLPKTGVLSFFYDLDSLKAGFDPKDKGCARVYWFKDKAKLHKAEFPDNLSERFRLSELAVSFKTELSYQDYGDFLLQREKLIENWDEFDDARKSLGIEEHSKCSKLLGWANLLRENMTKECELVRRGYYLGSDWTPHITPQDEQEAEQWANRDWLLLLQLDRVVGGYELPLDGGFGRLYFYIRREDLKTRDFGKVWLILQ